MIYPPAEGWLDQSRTLAPVRAVRGSLASQVPPAGDPAFTAFSGGRVDRLVQGWTSSTERAGSAVGLARRGRTRASRCRFGCAVRLVVVDLLGTREQEALVLRVVPRLVGRIAGEGADRVP